MKDIRTGLDATLTGDLWVFHIVAGAPSFQHAAEQLFVTQSAVSQRIARLEKRLGVRLFEKQGRKVILTSPGRMLAAVTKEAFGLLVSGVQRIRSQSGEKSIRVSCVPSMALEWLTPRIGRFLEQNTGTNVEIFGETHDLSLSALQAEGIDVAIRFGPRAFTDAPVAFRVNESCFPVAAPGLVEKLNAEGGRDEMTLLHDAMPWEKAQSPETEWRLWLNDNSLPWLTKQRHLYFNLAQLSYRAAIGGLGIAMGRSRIVTRFMAEGRLVRVANDDQALVLGIYVHTSRPQPPPHVQALLGWLSDELESQP